MFAITFDLIFCFKQKPASVYIYIYHLSAIFILLFVLSFDSVCVTVTGVSTLSSPGWTRAELYPNKKPHSYQ